MTQLLSIIMEVDLLPYLHVLLSLTQENGQML